MPTLTIDDHEVSVPPGATVLDAAAELGIEIPTVCHLPGRDPWASCFVCLVKVDGRESLVPACATKAVDGMRVESSTDEVRSARRAALELLLSDHLGDCIGPCQRVHPLGVAIPRVIRHVAAGRVEQAAAVLRERADPAEILAADKSPRWERACRRGQIDSPVAIDLVLRYVAGWAIKTGTPGPDPAPGVQADAFTTRIGKLLPEDIPQFMQEADAGPRVEPTSPDGVLTAAEAAAEARRCLHCDCRKLRSCRLRRCAEACGARAGAYRAGRRHFTQDRSHPRVLYEPGKCIACGLCVRITAEAHERLGLALAGRGFDVRPAVPFGRILSEGLTEVAEECVAACPTGALALRDAEEDCQVNHAP